MKFYPFLIQGPGSHAELIEEYLDKNFLNWDSSRYWPNFNFTRTRKGVRLTHGNKFYDLITYLAYAANNRLSGLTHNQQLHKEFLNNYFDKLCSKKLDEAKLLIAWTMVSLATIRKNKKLGGKTILEHGMAHIDHWMSANQKFYLDPTITLKPGYSNFTSRMIERMREEYELTDYIQVHSSFAKKTFLENNMASSKLLVCELGISPSFSLKTSSLTKLKKFTLLYVGRLELLKGVHLLLEVVSKLKTSEIDLILVGRVLPEITPFLEKFSRSNIKVIGPVNRDQISRYYQEADMLVFPTLNDAFGMVILEAMINNLPVIGSTSSAAPDIITDGANGLIVNSGDKVSLENSIRWAIDNRSKLVEMGLNAGELVRRKYLSSHYFERFERNLRISNLL